ncbi:MAG: HI0074 family nucleotidyltransferase substrate-binding subunit, partial [Gammaproteobacteria bacterium]|nr:HI0074 family nucleotidyltransferase substrate-binding subunit [Gammaproteobacteria bacterium]
MMFGLEATDFKTLMRIIIAHSAKLQRVTLFGSRARGDHKTHSDIDLAIDYQQTNEPSETTLQEDLESSSLPYTVDLIDLRLEKDTQLKAFIQKEGVVLYDEISKNNGDFWMTYAVLNEKLSDFKLALSRLDEALSKNIEADSLYLDGTIQRFEFTYELCWKLMKTYLAYLGIDANNPRAAIRESLKQNLIQDKDSAEWLEMIEKRNLTTHTYHKPMALTVYTGIKGDFIHLFHNFDEIISPLIATVKQ